MRRNRAAAWLGPIFGVAVFVAVGAVPPSPTTTRIELLGYSFDPVLDGEPALPETLRAHDADPYALLQLASPPDRETLDALRAAGVVFHDPLNATSYLVRLSVGPRTTATAKRAEIAALGSVRWIGALHAAYKISPSAQGGKVLLDLFPDADLTAVEAAVRGLGLVVLEQSATGGAKILVVEASASQLHSLAAIAGVRWVQDKPVYRLVNDYARHVVQTNQKGRLTLYDRGLSGAGQVGGVSDSGLDAFDFDNVTGAEIGTDANDAGCYFVDHGAGDITTQLAPSPQHRKVVGYTVPPGAGGDFTDENGHGTHVVGSVVGDQEPWGEVSSGDGQAYRARIFFQDVAVGSGLTVSPPSNYNDLFGPAYDVDADGAYDPELEPRTHSNSWGSADSTYDASTAQVDAFMWTHLDFLILFAAGNQGPGPLTVGNPGTAKNIITVGATENGDAEPNNMTEYSSHGPIPLSGPIGGGSRLSPTLGAPGNLTSALYKSPCGTQALGGTSMATPTTQGVALLMRQYLWDGYYPHGEPNPGDGLQAPPPSAALLKALLINSGQPMTGLFTDNATGGSWPSNGQGWGRILADDALYFQGDHRDLWIHDEYTLAGTAGLGGNGESQSFVIHVGDGSPYAPEPLEITLVWTDYPGAMLDGGRLINDLNLIMTDPSGAIHRGNDPAQNDFVGASDLPPAPDAVNPWEVVYLTAPAPGAYTISVNAAALGSLAPAPGRKQGFALVASGDLRSSRARAEIEREAYNPIPTASASLRVVDLDADTNPTAIDSITARVASGSDPLGVAVTLSETAVASATFVGDVVLVMRDQGQLPLAGELAVQKNDVIRLTYSDPDDGLGRAYEAFDTARVEDPAVTLLNPPLVVDPGEVDDDGSFLLEWSAAELSNNRGLSKTLAFYVVEESQDYVLHLSDDAEGELATSWTTTASQFSLPWTKSPAYNHTSSPPAPGESYWSQNVESGANALDADASLVTSQAIVLPASSSSARLTFYSRYFNEPDDTGTVEVSTNGGTTWTELLRLTDAPQTAPADTRMQHHEVDLSAYRGVPLHLRFRFTSTSNFYLFLTTGWWVDDIVVSAGSWQRIAVVAANETELAVSGRLDGAYSYRVQAVYTDGSGSAFGNVEGLVVAGAGVPAGRVGDALTIGRSGDDLTLAWGASCSATDDDYAVYEGRLGDFSSHEPVVCSTGGALGATVTPEAGDRYYLIVPRNASFEGSFGVDSAGTERPAGTSTCVARAIGVCE